MLGVAEPPDEFYTFTVGTTVTANPSGPTAGVYGGDIMLLGGAIPSEVKFRPGARMSYAGHMYENRLVLCTFDTANVLLTRNLESACPGTIYHVSSCHVDSELSSEFHFRSAGGGRPSQNPPPACKSALQERTDMA